ncbi:antibiotic biosynthesis monooxygenase family protein [Kitasatospora sp. A2-31]|uniref:antibiotic biosynthesis monooxygenase family protein n=1 Tax=Kitasatospora sp. A2-31 TaxID=2916414 RepID=UPI001EECF180|nr:antibiotic biosynthesis monooxygenase family protein [Kitasatospora sp. A2-31]MCG6495331.1 antibiotic biosynthesis monooxygenase [Kitasatospora sp. A2-31]
MIVRIWAGQVMAEHIEEFCSVLLSQVIPQLGERDGCLGGELLRSVSDDGHRVLVVSRWRDEEALRGYAGPMWRIRPVWSEGELRYLAHPPEVSHFMPVAAAQPA